MSAYKEFTGKTVEEALRLAREEFGAEFQDLDFEVPSVVGRHWYRAIDTAAASPADFPEPGAEEKLQGDKVRVRDRSIVVLISR